MEIQVDLFNDIVIVFVAAFLGTIASRAARLPTLVGYLGAGIFVGPHALGLISNPQDIRTLAELGVVLLLFAVGVEISLDDLRRSGFKLILAAIAQISITTLLGFGIGQGLGWSAGHSVAAGMVLSLSSTMVVFKTLSDRGEVGSLHARVATAFLLVQDLAFIPMMALLAAMSGDSDRLLLNLGWGALKAAVILGIVLVLGSKVVPGILRKIALFGATEAFVITVVALTLAAAAVTHSAGLSAGMGAFAAGLVLSESDWAGHKALHEVIPLRDIFSALFFASLGMLIDPIFVMENMGIVAIFVGTAIVGKFLIVAILVRGLGYLAQTSLLSGFSMVQIGEFSFIIAGAAEALGVSDASLLPLTIVAAAITMGVTPLAIAGAARMARPLSLRFERTMDQPLVEASAMGPHLSNHVVIAGLGRVGSFIANELDAKGVPFVGIDLDPLAVARLHSTQGHAIQGDSASEALLRRAGIQRARLLIVAVSDPVTSLVTVTHGRRNNPTLRVVARMVRQGMAESLQSAGADAVVWPEFEGAIEMMRLSLLDVGVESEVVEEVIEEAREEMRFGENAFEPDASDDIGPESKP